MKNYLSRAIVELQDTIALGVLCNNLDIHPIWKPVTVITCQWDKPAEDEIMINTDGSVGRNSNGCEGSLEKTFKPILYFHGNSVSKSMLEQKLGGQKLVLMSALRSTLSKVLQDPAHRTVLDFVLLCLSKHRSAARANIIFEERATFPAFSRWFFREVIFIPKRLNFLSLLKEEMVYGSVANNHYILMCYVIWICCYLDLRCS